MAVDDGNFDIMDLPDLILGNLDKGPGVLPSFHEFPQSQLCVPPDPIEDLEWFPSFSDDFISLNGVGLTLEHESSDCFAGVKPNQLPPQNLFCNFPVTPDQDEHEKTKQQTKSVMKQAKHQNGNNGMKKDWVGVSEAKFGGFTKKKARSEKKRCSNKLENQKQKRVKWERKRCSHCQTEETPQWRVGPLGPKTLCNACGVRFKSGRLVPEYRPAASPTFDGCRHSNYHKKILKRRSFDVSYKDLYMGFV